MKDRAQVGESRVLTQALWVFQCFGMSPVLGWPVAIVAVEHSLAVETSGCEQAARGCARYRVPCSTAEVPTNAMSHCRRHARGNPQVAAGASVVNLQPGSAEEPDRYRRNAVIQGRGDQSEARSLSHSSRQW